MGVGNDLFDMLRPEQVALPAENAFAKYVKF